MGNFSSCRSKITYRENEQDEKVKTHSNQTKSIELHTGPVFGLYRINDSQIVTCSEDKKIAIFDWHHPDDTVYLEGHKKAVNRVIFITFTKFDTLNTNHHKICLLFKSKR